MPVIATVTTRPFARRVAAALPARSICDTNQPPKMSPCGLVSIGIAMAQSVGLVLGGPSDLVAGSFGKSEFLCALLAPNCPLSIWLSSVAMEGGKPPRTGPWPNLRLVRLRLHPPPCSPTSVMLGTFSRMIDHGVPVSAVSVGTPQQIHGRAQSACHAVGKAVRTSRLS